MTSTINSNFEEEEEEDHETSTLTKLLDTINENFLNAARVPFLKRRPKLNSLGVVRKRRRYLTPTSLPTNQSPGQSSSSRRPSLYQSGNQVEEGELSGSFQNRSFNGNTSRESLWELEENGNGGEGVEEEGEEVGPLLRVRKPTRRELLFLEAVNEPDFFNKELTDPVTLNRTNINNLLDLEPFRWLHHSTECHHLNATLENYFEGKKEYLYLESKLLQFLSLGSFYQEKSEFVSIQNQFKSIINLESNFHDQIQLIQPVMMESGDNYRTLTKLQDQIRQEETEIDGYQKEYHETNAQLQEVNSEILEIERRNASLQQSLHLTDKDFPPDSYYHSLASLQKDLSTISDETLDLESQLRELEDEISTLDISVKEAECHSGHPSFRAFTKALNQLTHYTPPDPSSTQRSTVTIDILVNKSLNRLDELLRLSQLLEVTLQTSDFFRYDDLYTLLDINPLPLSLVYISKVIRSLVHSISSSTPSHLTSLHLTPQTPLIIAFLLQTLSDAAPSHPRGLLLDQLKLTTCQTLNVDRSLVSSTIYSLLARKLVIIDTSDLELLISLPFTF